MIVSSFFMYRNGNMEFPLEISMVKALFEGAY